MLKRRNRALVAWLVTLFEESWVGLRRQRAHRMFLALPNIKHAARVLGQDREDLFFGKSALSYGRANIGTPDRAS